MRSWVLQYDARPWTVNSERGRAGRKGQGTSGHWTKRAGLVREWREAFSKLAIEQKIPHLEAIYVVVEQFSPTLVIPDTGSNYPAVKAAIDGLRDANVIDDDTAKYVPVIVSMGPVKDKEIGNALRLTIYEVDTNAARWMPTFR